jgi:hypothetical protein
MDMAFMGGIERAAEKPDAARRETAFCERNRQGRTWPLPLTMYL